MTRTSSILVSGLATLAAVIFVAPATASPIDPATAYVQPSGSQNDSTTSLNALLGASGGGSADAVGGEPQNRFASVNAIVGSDQSEPAQASSGSDVRTVNAVLGGDQPQPTELAASGADARTVNAVLGGDQPQPTELAASGSDVRTVNAVLGGDQPQPTQFAAAPASASDGFDWGAALVGSAIASALLLLAFGAARATGRHRGATA